MLYSVLSTLFKLLLVAVVLAIEVSVALPVVSLAMLFLFLRDMNRVGQISMLVGTALLASSFTGQSWSLVFAILSVCWLGVEVVRGEAAKVRNRILLMSFAATLSISSFANMHISLRTVLYTLLFGVIAVVCTRTFAHQRSRYRLIEWISPGM
jgi:hypothetical protein